MALASYEQDDWYRAAPLYYDIIFDAGTAQESAFVAECIARYGRPKSKRLLEPACGTGRLLEALSTKGFSVEGYDLAPEMLAIAQERLSKRKATFKLWPDRLETFTRPGRYDAAYNLVSTFKYLLSEAAATSHLQAVAESLKPGGIYILGLHLSDYEDTMRSRERWHQQRGKLHVTCNIQSWPACKKTRTEEVRSRLVAREGTVTRKLETTWPFRCYNARQLKALLRRVPAFAHVATYDFCHDMARERELNDEQLDVVLVLRKTA